VDTVFTSPATPLSQKDYFTKVRGRRRFARRSRRLRHARRLQSGGAPPSHLMQAIRLSGTLPRSAPVLPTDQLGARPQPCARDAQAYGGVLSGAAVSNRTALAARLRPSVSQFAHLFMVAKLLKRGLFANAPRPPGAPLPNGLIDPAIDAMTDLFISWLEQHPSPSPQNHGRSRAHRSPRRAQPDWTQIYLKLRLACRERQAIYKVAVGRDRSSALQLRRGMPGVPARHPVLARRRRNPIRE
jgi:hypothetical protein